ncbi:hypothetical protein M5K25_014642 [Dendrobium thyrsiflorum]|uniref:Uncharacterized protein n=1 Tax=Dendrobium thyrsiflorum TaxID=117978 RepID=A0ABD0UVE0_DENTH
MLQCVRRCLSGRGDDFRFSSPQSMQWEEVSQIDLFSSRPDVSALAFCPIEAVLIIAFDMITLQSPIMGITDIMAREFSRSIEVGYKLRVEELSGWFTSTDGEEAQVWRSFTGLAEIEKSSAAGGGEVASRTGFGLCVGREEPERFLSSSYLTPQMDAQSRIEARGSRDLLKNGAELQTVPGSTQEIRNGAAVWQRFEQALRSGEQPPLRKCNNKAREECRCLPNELSNLQIGKSVRIIVSIISMNCEL